MSGFAHLKALSLGSKLTIRYMLALTLIACVIVLSYFLLINRLHQNENDAYIINISGMQRMLSQRIALTAHEVLDAQDAEEASEYADKMDAALKRMVVNHNILSQKTLIGTQKAPMSDVMREMYFSKHGVNERVQEYTTLGQRFVDVYRSEGLDALRRTGLMKEITRVEREGLLEQLNAVVSQYQKESEEAVVKFQQLEGMVMGVALFVLLLEVFFIFRPMVNNIVTTTDNLKDANEELLEFSYRISHDLRAPVISALGLGRLAAKVLKDGDEKTAQQSIEHANASLAKMDKVIDDVITLTKIKSVRQEKSAIDLEPLIDASIETCRHLPCYEKTDFKLRIEFDGKIVAREHALRQVLENLISNAVKYCDPKAEKPIVEIVARKKGKNCTVEVRDNGLGIKSEYHSKIFKMFQRFHPKVSFGTGLGLYIVYQNAKALDGEISYLPMDKGSLFTLKFPA